MALTEWPTHHVDGSREMRPPLLPSRAWPHAPPWKPGTVIKRWGARRTYLLAGVLVGFSRVPGTVLKRWDARRIYMLACQDIVERFHLGMALAFVLVEEMKNTGRWWPNPELLRYCAAFMAAEALIGASGGTRCCLGFRVF
jgi:Eukaryotic membrane protein family